MVRPRAIPLYTGPLYQRGGGLVSKFLVPIWDKIKPYAKRTLKRLGQNLAEGRPLSGAIKRAAIDTGKDVLDELRGEGNKRSRRADIFGHPF